ncbi:GGDEF domain-containing protein [Angustibacter sp. McL0619]|uniref:GGDEF domain-containing protein n=1 Tax=Angustibacter sp. McL0619 TaxID=3415676 RepID=UPI003CF68113
MSEPMARGQDAAATPLWVFDVAALVISMIGAVLVVLTQSPDWTTLCLLGLGTATLGSARRVWLVLALCSAGASLLVGTALHVVRTPTWTGDEIIAWTRSLLVLAAAGAAAVIVHGRLWGSRREVERALLFAQDATVHDPLTGLANRKGLAMLGAQILETARRRGDAVYCMFLDVDGLARVNTDLGHAAGDEVLLTVSEALTSSTRATDAVARWGDDEFVVVGPGTGLAPLEMERRVRARCLENSPVPREKWAARISAGGAVLEPWDDGDVDTLLRQADREMHLRRALRREAAAPAYQPVRLDPSPNPPDLRRPHGWAD